MAILRIDFGLRIWLASMTFCLGSAAYSQDQRSVSPPQDGTQSGQSNSTQTVRDQPLNDADGMEGVSVAITPDEAFPGATLPAPTRDPLAIERNDDPILNLVRQTEDPARFRRILVSAIDSNPSTAEALARTEEARAAEDVALSQRYPVADFTLSYFNTIARNFSNDPGNLIERSRPRSRADALASVRQPLIDFGSSANRVAAERNRISAAIYTQDVAAADVAIRGVSAWNGVFGYRALVQLGEAFQRSQGELRVLVEERIESGVSAPGDYAQVESYIASADARLADYRRAARSAESNFRELAGIDLPVQIGPAPVLAPMPTLEEAERMAEQIPAVLAARKRAQAAARDFDASRADQLPRLTAGVDAGNYGVIETGRDYDVRANVSLTYRLGGAGPAQTRAADARLALQEAIFARVRNEAVRDARIAWTDVEALEDAVEAIEANYLASRRARDVLLERFRVSRGTLFDVLAAEDNFFQTAGRYIQVQTELGVARTVLLARTGILLDAIGTTPIDAMGPPDDPGV